jgi:tight adherence protein C
MHRKQQSQYRAELPKMFDVIALGMRVGLGFDQAFALYVRGFKTPLADQCRPRFEVWERGLISRETGLRELAAQIQLKEFDRFVTLILRALDYGAPLTNMLGDLAREARSAYRSERQEMVAKAPVKMLIPTGVLILPAMMMLVIGPIVLDITERMV